MSPLSGIYGHQDLRNPALLVHENWQRFTGEQENAFESLVLKESFQRPVMESCYKTLK
jgi:hypothetical protein